MNGRSLPSKLRSVLALGAVAVAVTAGVDAAPAHAAVPVSCTSPHVSLYQPTGGTWAGYADAVCSNSYFYIEVMVKENGVVIRDNAASTYSTAWYRNSVRSSPYFYCVHGRGYQAVALSYRWTGTAWSQTGYWTTGTPRTLC
jgi:hypothetical protein